MCVTMIANYVNYNFSVRTNGRSSQKVSMQISLQHSHIHPHPGDDRCILTLGRTILHEDDGNISKAAWCISVESEQPTSYTLTRIRPSAMSLTQSLHACRRSSIPSFSKEANGIVERANQEVMRHLRAIRFDAPVHYKWYYEHCRKDFYWSQSCRTHSQQFDLHIGSNPRTTGF